MELEKRSKEELLLRIQELELLLGKNRHLQLNPGSIFDNPDFNEFFNLALDGKIIANQDGIIIGWNKAIEMISGIKATYALGKFIWDIKYELSHPEERNQALLEKLKSNIQNAFQHADNIPDLVHEFQIKNSNHEVRFLEDHSTFIVHDEQKYFLSIIRDITEKKAYNQAIIESEERHRGLLNSLELGILVYSPKGEVLFANPKACDWFGIKKYQHENLFRFKKEIEFLSENSSLIAFHNCPARAILRHKESIKNSLIGSRIKGEKDTNWYLLNGFPQMNENGEIQEVVISLLDVSDRRKMVQALHIKNAALDSSILPIGTTDIYGNLNYVNPRMVSQWGYENEEEMIGKSAINFWHQADQVRIFIEQAIKNGSETGELIAKKKDQSLFPVACKISTIHDENDQFIGLVGSFEDLSVLKKSQQTLKESEEKFKSIANYSASWEGWFDLNGQLVWMNQNSIQLTGYTPEEYKASSDFLSMCIYYEDLPAVSELFLGALQGSSGENLEIRCNKKEGGFIWLSISWRPIYNSDGQSIGFRTSSQDITEKIRAKLDLEKSKKQYDNLVANIDVGVFILHGN
ncbi:MAG: PAS domain-containing protein [Bacteroidia bacterium]